jgi:murein DD-endopeptidase MepM/ murein hydrolase activator NlpD
MSQTPHDLADSLRALGLDLKSELNSIGIHLNDLQEMADQIEMLVVAPADDPHWLAYPLDYRPIAVTGEFGVKDAFYTWTHEGIDFAVPVGHPVRACGDGKVIVAGNKAGYGKCVRIEHKHPTSAEKWWTWYGHLSVISVLLERRIRAGDIVGLSGATGNVTGPHLHLTVQRETSTFQPPTWSVNLRGSVNPREFLIWPG